MRKLVSDSEVGDFMRHVLIWIKTALAGELDLGEVIKAVQEIIARNIINLDHVEPHPDSCTIEVPVDTGELTPPVSGWRLEDDVTDPVGELTLEVVGFMTEDDDDRIEGEEMVRRARRLEAELGQRHGQALLDQQGQIPLGWREFELLVFPFTTWYSPRAWHVYCLYWRHEEWHAHWSTISGISSKSWRRGHRLVRVCQST